MLSEQIRGVANHVIVGLLIDNKIIRLLYSIANEVEKLEDNLERIEGERIYFGDRVAQLKEEFGWMYREIERAGEALFIGTMTPTLHIDDLKNLGQTIEGVCDTNSQLFDILEAARNEIDNCPFCKRGMECKVTHYKLRKAIDQLWKEK